MKTLLLTFENDTLATLAIPVIEDALGGNNLAGGNANMTRGIDYELTVQTRVSDGKVDCFYVLQNIREYITELFDVMEEIGEFDEEKATEMLRQIDSVLEKNVRSDKE